MREQNFELCTTLIIEICHIMLGLHEEMCQGQTQNCDAPFSKNKDGEK